MVASVSNPLAKLRRLGDVVFLSWPTDQPDRIAKHIAGGVDFVLNPPRERPRP